MGGNVAATSNEAQFSSENERTLFPMGRNISFDAITCPVEGFSLPAAFEDRARWSRGADLVERSPRLMHEVMSSAPTGDYGADITGYILKSICRSVRK